MRSTFCAALAACSLLALGCADLDTDPDPSASSCGAGAPHAFVISTLGFTRVDPMKGTAPGFDVDGVVSDGTDAASCNKKDFTGPNGEKGIDNQLAALIPDVEKVLGNAVDGLLQGAINNGDLLILMNVEGAGSM